MITISQCRVFNFSNIEVEEYPIDVPAEADDFTEKFFLNVESFLSKVLWFSHSLLLTFRLFFKLELFLKYSRVSEVTWKSLCKFFKIPSDHKSMKKQIETFKSRVDFQRWATQIWSFQNLSSFKMIFFFFRRDNETDFLVYDQFDSHFRFTLKSCYECD